MKSVSHYYNLLIHVHTSGLITLLKLNELHQSVQCQRIIRHGPYTTSIIAIIMFSFFLSFISIFCQACPQVVNNTMESPGYPSYYSHSLDCNIFVPIPLGANVRVFFQVFDIGGYNWNCR